MRVTVMGLAMAGLGLLAACSDGSDGSSGGGGDGPDEPPPLPGPLSLADMDAEAVRIDTATDALDYTDPAGLPMSGQAVYEGVMGIGVDLDTTSVVPDFLVGRASLGVDFEDGDVVGQAGHFVGPGDQTYGGTLAITGGELNRDINPDGGGWTYEADIDGTLSSGDDRLVVDAEVLGDFYGEDHRYAQGLVTNGTIAGSDGTSFPVDGRFVMER